MARRRRMFNVAVINERTGSKVVMTNSPEGNTTC